jgi:hypothetical protein
LVGDKRLRVELFSQVSSETLSDMNDELLFGLAALCQHENLTVDEMRAVLNVRIGLADFVIRYLRENKLIEPVAADKHRLTLSPRHYRQILRVLRGKHLLWEAK